MWREYDNQSNNSDIATRRHEAETYSIIDARIRASVVRFSLSVGQVPRRLRRGTPHQAPPACGGADLLPLLVPAFPPGRPHVPPAPALPRAAAVAAAPDGHGRGGELLGSVADQGGRRPDGGHGTGPDPGRVRGYVRAAGGKLRAAARAGAGGGGAEGGGEEGSARDTEGV